MGRLSSALVAALLSVAAPAVSTAPSPAEENFSSSPISGMWKVVSLRGAVDLSVDDLVEFTEDGQLVTYFHQPLDGRQMMHQSFELDGRRLKVESGRLDVDFRVNGNSLRLTTPDGFVDVIFRRAGEVIVG